MKPNLTRRFAPIFSGQAQIGVGHAAVRSVGDDEEFVGVERTVFSDLGKPFAPVAQGVLLKEFGLQFVDSAPVVVAGHHAGSHRVGDVDRLVSTQDGLDQDPEIVATLGEEDGHRSAAGVVKEHSKLRRIPETEPSAIALATALESGFSVERIAAHSRCHGKPKLGHDVF